MTTDLDSIPRDRLTGFTFYKRPVRQVDGEETTMIKTRKAYLPVTRPKVYWKYRRGGYNPADGSYGRCMTYAEAMRLCLRADLSPDVTIPLKT